MPLDPSKHHSDRRRLNRDPIAAIRQDGMYSREIEMKRNRGEISCAECRRYVIGPAPRSLLFSFFSRPVDLKSSATSKYLVNPVRCVPPNQSLPFEPSFDPPCEAERLCFFVSERSVVSSIFLSRIVNAECTLGD